MKPKMIVKIGIDIAMTVAMLLLMAYQLIGEEAHEWIGVFMFVLFVTHHLLNGAWGRNILRGKYNVRRIVQTMVVFLILLSESSDKRNASGTPQSRCQRRTKHVHIYERREYA